MPAPWAGAFAPDIFDFDGFGSDFQWWKLFRADEFPDILDDRFIPGNLGVGCEQTAKMIFGFHPELDVTLSVMHGHFSVVVMMMC